MFVYFSKILPLLVMPIGLVLELCAITFLLVLNGKKRISAFMLLITISLLWVSSMPFVAENLMGRLESAYPPVMVTELPKSECAIVMGGAVGPVLPPRIDIDMKDGVDRVRKAAQLSRLGLAKTIIVTGGNQPWSLFPESEAESIKSLLLEWGVAAEDIVLETQSRNTRENAFYTKDVLEELACEKPLLVTSAAHMERAMEAFRRLRIEVVPVATDVRVADRPQLTVFDFLPDAEALLMSNDAVREWLGQRVYELNGWN